MIKRPILILAFSLLIQCNNNPAPEGGIVATNAWTAAYALTAGIENITLLAPYEMVHPSEYEMRPGDIARIKNADLIIYAGYELLIDQIKSGLKVPDDKMLAINTSYSYEEIRRSVMQIAKRVETEEVAKRNLEEIEKWLEYGEETFRNNGLDTIPALIHFFQKSFAAETGLYLSKVFGPAPPEPRQILSLTQTHAALIIDNAHNPVGGPLRETMPDAKYVELLNFPGLYNTRTLTDVIKYNIGELVNVYEESKSGADSDMGP